MLIATRLLALTPQRGQGKDTHILDELLTIACVCREDLCTESYSESLTHSALTVIL